MTLFDTQPWLVTAAPVPAVDDQWRNTQPLAPVFREPPPAWPTVSPAAAVEAATSALSPFSQLGGTPARLAATIYDPPEGLADAPAAPGWDLVLVVDTSPSMTAWYPAANAIAACAHDMPCFHSVHVVKMHNRRPTLRGDLFASADLPVLHAERFSPDRPKITLVLTDGVGAAWHRRLLWEDLHQWATCHTVAILHVLPHHHWSLAGIPTQPIQLRAPQPCCPNRNLETTPTTDGRSPVHDGDPTASQDSVLIPVLEIRKRWLDQWTRLLLTDFLVHQQTLTIAAPSLRPVVPSPAPAHDDASGPDQLITDFHTTAPEHAFDLAVLLAAAPLNRFVMQLIAAELAPPATTRDLSAVLTSGLLVSIDSPIDEEDSYGGITFDFLPGVRQSLLAWGESSQTHRVVSLLDTYLSPFAPALKGLSTRMRSPDVQALPPLTSRTAPYLEIEHSLLTALSGETPRHRIVAHALRQRLDALTSTRPAASVATRT
ncbi:SAV_2336 N-terminal domain-related protein [Streptomyces albogriseolus]|uniref:SAV_2336 N-terminal domain-related protein n=1 Tax=Streptomyces albogriseolus TaxID=1887 RepID=UPI00378E3CD7